MRFFCFIALAVFSSLSLRAQTNAPETLPLPRRTTIESVTVTFDPAGHKVIYLGNVRLNDQDMKLTCDWLAADLPQRGEHINNIVAATNVVIDFKNEKAQPMHATSDRAIYFFNVQSGRTNETVTLTGNAKIEEEQGWLTGEPIIWDRTTGFLTASNQMMIFKQTPALLSPTNAAPATTNASPKSGHE